ncbi:MAG: DUF805 domain-containing protein [Sphingomonadales bacterium]|nr:DUF805 domain-containing protein [Sphingomonadales bacterium]MBD3773228.1 DUF805 domain-containing protein [Paracoccaceae bacterium]
MLGSIKYNLANLANFNGRDARQTFWYYVLFLVVIQFGAGIIAAIPMYSQIFSSAFNGAQSGMSEQQMQAMMFAQMGDSLRTQVWVSAAIGVVMTLLLIAAFVRRLHDAGYPGLIVLVPVATYLFSLAYNISNIDNVLAAMEAAAATENPQQALSMQGQMVGAGLVSWIGIIVVIVFGVMKSQAGPNKYGDAPVRY